MKNLSFSGLCIVVILFAFIPKINASSIGEVSICDRKDVKRALIKTEGETLSGPVELQSDTCIQVKGTLVVASDFLLTTKGFKLEISVDGDLRSEDGALIRAFDYTEEATKALLPFHYSRDQFNLWPISYEPGPGTNGYRGDGRNGGSGKLGSMINNGNSGSNGKSSDFIRLVVKGSAEGTLRIDGRGAPGWRGQDGPRGSRAGHGEQGQRGQSNNLGLCDVGPAFGGNGGKGGDGNISGVGGNGGNGGKLSVSIGGGHENFELYVDYRGGAAGLPGSPGQGSSGGKQGCGGRGSAGCMQRVWTRQGFRGDFGKSSIFSSSGTIGKAGSINTNVAYHPLNQQLICAPFVPPPEMDRDEIDRKKLSAFLGAIAESGFGAIVIPVSTQDGKSINILTSLNPPSWISSINFKRVGHYVGAPPPKPIATPGSCRNADCCKPSPWLGCLQAKYWDFDSTSPHKRYVVARQEWLKLMQELLAIEIARNARFSDIKELAALSADGDVWLNLPTINSTLYVKLDAALFARIAFVLSEVQPQLRHGLHIDTPRFADTTVCRAGRVEFYGPESKPANTNYPQFVVGPIKAIQMFSPTSESMYFGLPVYYSGDELIFGQPTLNSNPIKVSGFENTGYCEFAKFLIEDDFHNPLACAAGDREINALIRLTERDLDFPSISSVLFSLKYIEAMLTSLPSDINEHVDQLLHCPPEIPGDFG